MATHSSTLSWKIPWMEKPGRLQSMRSLRVRHDWATSLSLFTFMHWRRKWQPSLCSCLENPRDGGAWWAVIYGVAQSRTLLKRLSNSSSNPKNHSKQKHLKYDNQLQVNPYCWSKSYHTFLIHQFFCTPRSLFHIFFLFKWSVPHLHSYLMTLLHTSVKKVTVIRTEFLQTSTTSFYLPVFVSTYFIFHQNLSKLTYSQSVFLHRDQIPSDFIYSETLLQSFFPHS